jgi:hypothetical protein
VAIAVISNSSNGIATPTNRPSTGAPIAIKNSVYKYIEMRRTIAHIESSNIQQ